MPSESLTRQKMHPNDELYTLYESIEEELIHYEEQFENKIIYLPCDDPVEKESQFWQYFVNNFKRLKIKKLIATYYNPNGQAKVYWKDNDSDDELNWKYLESNGDFRNKEIEQFITECDIICTNPPFSLAREFLPWLFKYKKKFLIISNELICTYKITFPFFFHRDVTFGYSKPRHFRNDKGEIIGLGNAIWITNLDIEEKPFMELTSTYSPEKYPFYDNYDAINVDKQEEIPCDYAGVIGVPVTCFRKINYHQFKVIGLFNRYDFNDFDNGIIIGEKGKHIEKETRIKYSVGPIVNQKAKYARLLIQHVNPLTSSLISDMINISNEEKEENNMQALNATETKKKYIESVFNMMMNALENAGHANFKECFSIEGTSIMCNLPIDSFNGYTIPANTKIEMKFVTKKV